MPPRHQGQPGPQPHPVGPQLIQHSTAQEASPLAVPVAKAVPTVSQFINRQLLLLCPAGVLLQLLEQGLIIQQVVLKLPLIQAAGQVLDGRLLAAAAPVPHLLVDGRGDAGRGVGVLLEVAQHVVAALGQLDTLVVVVGTLWVLWRVLKHGGQVGEAASRVVKWAAADGGWQMPPQQVQQPALTQPAAIEC